jgi:polyisoprenoid-binding protein YceI
MHVSRRLVFAGLAVLAPVALGGGGAYLYFFSGLHTSPAQLGLASPSATSSSPTPTASASTTGLAGNWTVATGSLVGYRVKELFVGETSKHDAVARTSTVSGGLTVAGDATSGYQISAITITAALTDLHSVDQVAGHDVSLRDSFVSRQMNLQQFPNATFTATSASIPGPVTAQQVNVSVPGSLTVHGVAKTVTATAKAQQSGDKLEIAGSVSIVMTDYGVTPPQVPFTTVDPQVTIEFDVFLTRSA